MLELEGKQLPAKEEEEGAVRRQGLGRTQDRGSPALKAGSVLSLELRLWTHRAWQGQVSACLGNIPADPPAAEACKGLTLPGLPPIEF